MGKSVEEICNDIINNRGDRLPKFKKSTRCLSDCIKCNNPANPYSGGALYGYDGLYDRLERIITQKLAQALDENSPYKIRALKEEYGHLEEFARAKKFLSQKSKEVWNVFTPVNNVPKDAMKALGITNCPDLDSMLYTCLNYFEKDGKDATVQVLNSILSNENIPYSLYDVHKYLKTMHENKGIKYNCHTIRYLIYEHNYNETELKELGASKEIVTQAVKTLPVKYRLKFLFKKLD